MRWSTANSRRARRRPTWCSSSARARRTTLLLEKDVTGGQISLTSQIENYPGVPDVHGFELGQIMQKQAEKYGMETQYHSVEAIEPEGDLFLLRTSGGDFIAGALIVAAGADYRRLGVPGEAELTGRGVSYCKYELARTYVAAVAEVEVSRSSGDIKCTRFYVAHDCGQIINPDGLKNQIEGNVIQTVSRTLVTEVMLRNRS